MTKTSHELLKQEKKENKVIEYVKKAGKTSILRYYVLKYCLTTGHFPKTILTRYCNKYNNNNNHNNNNNNNNNIAPFS